MLDNENLELRTKPNTQEQEKTLLEQITSALNDNAKFTEQIKLSLLALHEILTSHKALEDTYAFLVDECSSLITELENKKGSFEARAKEYLSQFDALLEQTNTAKDESLENAEDAAEFYRQNTEIKTQCEAFLNEIKTKSLEFETQLAFLKQVSEEELPKIEEALNLIPSKITELENKKQEILQEFQSLAAEVLTKANELKQEYFTELESKQEQTLTKANEALNLIDEKILSFDKKYTSIKFINNTEPTNTDGVRLSDLWLDTKQGIIRAYTQNPFFSHYGTSYPQHLARLSDLWLKGGNELFCLREDSDLNLKFLKVNEKVLEAKYKQNTQPDLAKAVLGDLWFKCEPMQVYYLENKSWVQIDQKLVRFKQNTQPQASDTNVIEINDIWQNTDTNTFYIYANKGEANEWIKLEEVFNYTKFKGSDFPELANDDSEDIANKALMRDLYFKCDESELYICLQTNTDKVFKKVAEAKEEAKYKQELEPSILKENVLIFKNENDDENEDGFYTGEVFAYKPQNYEDKWLRLNYLKENAHFKDNDSFEISSRYARAYDVWYKESEDELYIYLPKPNSVFEWKKIAFKTPTYAHTSTQTDRENAKLGEVYHSVENDSNPYIFSKKGINLDFVKITNAELLEREIKPFWWYNSLLKDFYARVKKVDYKLSKLDKDLRELIASESAKLSTALSEAKVELTNNLNSAKTDLDSKITQTNTDLSNSINTAKTELTNTINTKATSLQTSINNVNARYNYDYKVLATNVAAIDFRTALNFKLTLTAARQITSVSVAGCEGKTGVIFVQGANFISSFASPFNFRIAQSGFGTWELFSYCIINGVIRLTRS